MCCSWIVIKRQFNHNKNAIDMGSIKNINIITFVIIAMVIIARDSNANSKQDLCV